MRFALIAEGPIDFAVIETLLRRAGIISISNQVNPFSLRQLALRKHLKILSGRYGNPAARIDRVIVLKDSGGNTYQATVSNLQGQVANANWPFPVKIGAAVQEIEAWLIADHQSLSRFAGIPCN